MFRVGLRQDLARVHRGFQEYSKLELLAKDPEDDHHHKRNTLIVSLVGYLDPATLSLLPAQEPCHEPQPHSHDLNPDSRSRD